MTPRGANRPTLHVEGTDDLHSIIHLLRRHNVDESIIPSVKETQGKESLLELVETAVPLAEGRPVGFVLDADSPRSSRWAQVGERLQRVGLQPPPRVPKEGYVATSQEYQTKVGVWLMPDNDRDGTLEMFLRDLIQNGDQIIGHAEQATSEARSMGADFSDPQRPKAVIHAWLAWQEEPGLPYGTAIKAHYFGKDSVAARRFVGWIKSLFGG